jgi:hypothetical protein
LRELLDSEAEWELVVRYGQRGGRLPLAEALGPDVRGHISLSSRGLSNNEINGCLARLRDVLELAPEELGVEIGDPTRKRGLPRTDPAASWLLPFHSKPCSTRRTNSIVDGTAALTTEAWGVACSSSSSASAVLASRRSATAAGRTFTWTPTPRTYASARRRPRRFAEWSAVARHRPQRLRGPGPRCFRSSGRDQRPLLGVSWRRLAPLFKLLEEQARAALVDATNRGSRVGLGHEHEKALVEVGVIAHVHDSVPGFAERLTDVAQVLAKRSPENDWVPLNALDDRPQARASQVHGE